MVDILYIRIRSAWLSVRNVTKQISYDDLPKIAFDLPGKKVVAIGQNAESVVRSDRNYILLDGFNHPRTILCDHESAEVLLKHFFLKVGLPFYRRMFRRPKMIFHPLEKLEGGLTRLEALSLAALGFRTFARKVVVWTGRELTDEELSSQTFPMTDGAIIYEQNA